MLLVTALVGIIGSPPAAAVEQSALIDFEAGFSAGDTPGTLSIGRGMSGADLGTVSLVGFNPDIPGNSAMIYDATCGGQTAPPGDPAFDPALCSDDDADLYVPSAGNIAIITEDGNAEVPDDALREDTFWTLDFTDWGPGAVTVDSFGVADIDFGQTGAEASFFDAAGGLLAVIPIPEIGDNAATIIPAGVAGVASMEVALKGSGAIDLISITVDEPLVDVELTKTADPAAVPVGGETTFSVSLVNQGPDDATGVVVEDRLPAGLTYVSHSGDGSFDPETGLWTIGDAPVGEVFTLDLVVTVDAAGEFTNVAEVIEHNETDIDSTPGNNVPEEDDQDSATVVASPLIDVELDKSVAPAAVRVGATTTFSVLVTNKGPQAATGVVVEDRLPAGLTYVSHSGDGSFDPATFIWTIGDLAVGASVSIDFVVSVDEVGSFTNVAEVIEHNETDIDSTPGNNVPEEDDQDSAIVTATDDPLIDVELDKSVANEFVAVGDEATFTVFVENQGPDDATGVVVEDRLPAGLTYVSHSGDGSFDPATFIWTIGDLAAGASVSMDLVVTVDEFQETFENVAEVIEHNETDIDSTPGNNVPEEDDQDSAIIFPSQVEASSTIGDFVWFDDNADGVQDPDEDGVPNVTVRLTNQATNEVSTQVTNANGLYLFSGLDAGTYLVQVLTSTFPDNYGLTTVGSYTVTLQDDESFLDADFGIVTVLPITGLELESFALIGFALLALGGGLLALERRRRVALLDA
jgi:uncharacterized repeat protein (TIGR01451 family)